MPRYRGTTFFQVCLGRLADVGVESGLDGVGFGNHFLPESLKVENDHFGDSTRLPGPRFPLHRDYGRKGILNISYRNTYFFETKTSSVSGF